MSDDTAPVLVALARLEGKLDASLATHGTTISTHAAAIDDHEARLRRQEARSTISPRQFWAGLGGVFAAASSLAGIIRVLFPA